MKLLLLIALIPMAMYGTKYKAEGFCKTTYMEQFEIYARSGEMVNCPGDGQAITGVRPQHNGDMTAICTDMVPICAFETDIPGSEFRAEWQCSSRPFPYLPGFQTYQGKADSYPGAMVAANKACREETNLSCVVVPFSCERLS